MAATAATGSEPAAARAPRRGLDGSAGGDHVVDDQGLASLDIAADPVHGDLPAADTGLVNDCDGKLEELRVAVGEPRRAEIRSDDDPVGADGRMAQSFGEQRNGRQVLERQGEEAFERRTVKIDGDDAIEAAGLEQVGDQPGPDRFPAARPPILSGITEVRNHRRQAGGARAAAGVGEQEKLDEVRLHRRAGRNDEVNVVPANALEDPHVALAVGETLEVALSELQLELAGDSAGQGEPARAREDHRARPARGLVLPRPAHG